MQNTLIKAMISGRAARDRELANCLRDGSLLEFFQSVLDHPFLLPLMELKLNGCTSCEHGYLLIQQGLAAPFTFVCENSLYGSSEFVSLEVLSAGDGEYQELVMESTQTDHFLCFKQCLSAYSCMDSGKGICATREFISEALWKNDVSLFRHLVDPETGARVFNEEKLKANALSHNSKSRLKSVIDLKSEITFR